MSHLTLEVLARLVDEAAVPEEEAHLEECARCRAELTGLRDQHEAMAALPRLMPAPDAWPAIRERLRRERLVQPAQDGAGGSGPRWYAGHAVRAAAAVLLLLAGGLGGYALRGGPEASAPARLASEPMAEGAAAEEAGQQGAAVEEPGQQAGFLEVGGLETEAAADDPAVEEDFQLALDRFMADSPAAEDPAARLAALDNILLIAAEALHEAPTDPVINGYYRTAVAQRNAILRQIESTRSDPVF